MVNKLKPGTLKALHAEWRKVAQMLRSNSAACGAGNGEEPQSNPSLADNSALQDDRGFRLTWTNQVLGRTTPDSPPQPRRGSAERGVVASWNDLSENQARYLLRKMREESGDGAAYRARLIVFAARDLFGAEWDQLLSARLEDRWHVFTPDKLTPAQAHAEIEELLSRIARRDDVPIDELRAKYREMATGRGAWRAPRTEGII